MKIYVDTTNYKGCLIDNFIISYESSEIYFDRANGCLCAKTNNNNEYCLIYAKSFYKSLSLDDKLKFERNIFAHLLDIIEISQDDGGNIIKITYLNENRICIHYSDYESNVDYVIDFQDLINDKEEMNGEDIC